MRVSRKTGYATLGTLLTIAGVIGSYVMLLQPWTNCLGIDGRSASCQATPSDPGVGLLLGLALFVLVTGIIVLAASISIRRERIPSDAAGPFGKLD
jgi:hypothetical protein